MRESIEWKFCKGKADIQMIICIEKILDIKFPDDFIQCITQYPSGTPFPRYFKTKEKTTQYGYGGSFEYFYNFDPESELYILRQYHGINIRSGGDNKVPDGIVPFASASFNHDDLCFDYRKGFTPTIVLFDLQFHWDYLAYLEDPEFCKEVKEEDYLIHICDSFGELLDMLEEEPEE